jgi:hypothetical protein
MQSEKLLLYWTLGTLFLMGCAISDNFVTQVPPRSSTYGTIWVMKQRILRYAKAHNALPESVDNLPKIPDKIDGVQDAWGRKIIMEFSDGKATLTSLGRDGKPGGKGDNADMSGVFLLRYKNGDWADESTEWIQKPEL